MTAGLETSATKWHSGCGMVPTAGKPALQAKERRDWFGHHCESYSVTEGWMQARRLHDSRSGDQRYKMALGMGPGWSPALPER